VSEQQQTTKASAFQRVWHFFRFPGTAAVALVSYGALSNKTKKQNPQLSSVSPTSLSVFHSPFVLHNSSADIDKENPVLYNE
jgi:hypothetical protein